MQLVTIKKKTNGKIEQAKRVISIFCLLMDIKLSDTELTVLAFLQVYKINRRTRDLIISSNILKSEDSVKTVLSRLKKLGLLHRPPDSKEYVMNQKLDITLNSVVGILIKIDNT